MKWKNNGKIYVADNIKNHNGWRGMASTMVMQ